MKEKYDKRMWRSFLTEYASIEKWSAKTMYFDAICLMLLSEWQMINPFMDEILEQKCELSDHLAS
jgi:hypothetical protein